MTTVSRDDLTDLISRGRRSRKRRERIEKFIVRLMVSAMLAFLNGWTLMLAVGIAHEHWIRQLPTIGYWWSVSLVVLLRGVFSKISDSKSDGAK